MNQNMPAKGGSASGGRKTLLITIDFPPQTGGVANYLANFCQNLPDNKLVVLANKVENVHHFDGHQKYKIIRENLLSRYFWPKWLRTYFIARKIIREEKIEQIIISHILPMGYIALMLKLPFIIILHGYDIMNAQKSSWKKYWAKKILSKARYIIVNSHNTQKQVLKLSIPENKITIVYPCPNIKTEQLNEHEKQIIKNELNLHHKKIMISVGRLTPRKGFDKVIEALPEVIKQIPNLVYIIVGNGPDRERLEKLAEDLKVRGNLIIAEDIPNSNLSAFYDLANIFIMPARQIGEDIEGFGIVYLEANLFSKPVIAGRSGGVEDAVLDGQTGILVNPESVQEIGSAILRLFNDPELANKLGIQGKERVLLEFQWPKQIEKIKNIL
ncbi:MAG: glycosyltransferase family 4 protein [Candidatus Parcubacteria bacterium]|nr:glycosyltransferase family 4 protein [Candidatus Parcubacteria bacterium]